MTDTCRYCNKPFTDPVVSTDYERVAHFIQECTDIPRFAKRYYDCPWVRSKLRYRVYFRLHQWWYG